MRDLPAPSPSVQQALARMYAQRVPSRPKQIGRMPEQEVDQPWYKDVANALGSAYEWLRDNRVQTVTGGVGGPVQTQVATPVEQAVEPLRVAGRRAVGDITAIPGVGADSPSYTAEEFRNENPWAAALKTALDYGSIAALGAQGVGATRNAIRPQYGVHVSPTSGLTEISPRSVGATQAAAADAKVGSTYMWDARSPRLLNEVFDNPQMAGIAGMGETPSVYVTRARGQVFQDANALNSPAIRVAGPQQVLGEVPYTREALLNFLESQGIRPRGATADRLAQWARGLSPTVRSDVANRPFQMAEERLRAAIRIGRENPNSQWGALAGLDETADIGTLLDSPEARGFFDNFVEMSGGTRGTYPELPPRSALAAQMARAAQGDDYLGTVKRQPHTLMSDEFPGLSSVSPESGGLPDELTGSTQQVSWPIYNVGDQQFLFGPTRVGRFDPPVNLTGINRLPINPYAITGQAPSSPLGQQYAEMFFDALHGYGIENGVNAEMGMVPALLKAASSGDDVALRELERFAEIGRKSLAATRLQQTPAMIDQRPIEVIVGRDATGTSITRPIETKDIFVVHQTQYKPTVDSQGNVIIRPPKDYGITDELTGKPMLDPITGDPVVMERNSIHFALNHLVGGNTGRSVPTGRSYIVISPLDDVLKANPGALDNLYAVDSFMTPEPGKGLVVPMSSGRIIEIDGASQMGYVQPKGNPYDWSPEQQAAHSSLAAEIDAQASSATQQALRELGKQRFGEGYETRIFERGDAYSSSDVDSSIARLASEQIGRDFPEYGGSVPSIRHNTHPFSHYERMLMPSSTTDPHLLRSIYEAWMFSPNAKRRFFNNDLFTTASTKLSYPESIL